MQRQAQVCFRPIADTAENPLNTGRGRLTMRNTRLLGIALASLVGATAAHAATPVATKAPRVLGAWRLVETRQRLVDGSSRTDPDLGAHPSGYMIYDPSGRMCTVFSDTDRPRWSAAGPTDADLRAVWQNTVSYCARYVVDEARGVIVFHMEHGASPNTVGTTRERRFELVGDSLTLYPVPLPAGVTAWTIHLQRVRP